MVVLLLSYQVVDNCFKVKIDLFECFYLNLLPHKLELLSGCLLFRLVIVNACRLEEYDGIGVVLDWSGRMGVWGWGWEVEDWCE